MRTSNQQYVNGQLHNGFDYDLQVWVIKGKIQRCGHPGTMQCNCYGRAYQNESIVKVRQQLGL